MIKLRMPRSMIDIRRMLKNWKSLEEYTTSTSPNDPMSAVISSYLNELEERLSVLDEDEIGFLRLQFYDKYKQDKLMASQYNMTLKEYRSKLRNILSRMM
ncbi:hypothetical protein [Liquorilactobacillus hordei]|uniref:hypothetical protein n=1 Tax=Liquorilactobacillus hordei TaxID=468911 RepID=UPI001CBB32A5|nr:hypothetical protein [Liquorilactobacillus hordei]MBZ2406137.1 hypothetical protein [Liquorilactobacillus hordei]